MQETLLPPLPQDKCGRGKMHHWRGVTESETTEGVDLLKQVLPCCLSCTLELA